MSLPNLHGTGRLISDPKTGTSRNGQDWTSAVVKFQAWRKGDNGWEEGDHAIAACIAFGDTAATLARFSKGDEVELRGPASLALYDGKPQLRVTIDVLPAADQAAQAAARTGGGGGMNLRVVNPEVICGPCHRGTCDYIGCFLPKVCYCRDHRHIDRDADQFHPRKKVAA